VTLIEGGSYGDRRVREARRRSANSKRRVQQRRTARAAAPLLVPLALALTLGIILAVSSAPSTAHVNQQSTTISSNP
jgi:hypothetical protein